ncbi:MAG: hypothetical protein Q7S15_02470 [bacterium]|nr:hypothetical protein [bacterium]
MKKLLAAKLKDVPPAEQEKILTLIEKHPEFMQKISAEIQQKMKEGKDQMSATFEVMRVHQDELRKLMS